MHTNLALRLHRLIKSVTEFLSNHFGIKPYRLGDINAPNLGGHCEYDRIPRLAMDWPYG